jgi:dTMP kinase
MPRALRTPPLVIVSEPSSPKPQGLFLTLEGIRGSGKSSQAQTLKALLEAKGYRVALTCEPGGCELGRRLQGLLNDGSIDLDPRAELFLFEAARAQHVAEVILPALASHDVVICDRFADSSVAYQGHGRGLGLNHVRVANLVATQGLVPDLTVVLNVGVDLGLARKGGETVPDRIGGEVPDFHERVRRGYLALATEEPERFVVVDATLSAEEITERIWRRLEPLLPPRAA